MQREDEGHMGQGNRGRQRDGTVLYLQAPRSLSMLSMWVGLLSAPEYIDETKQKADGKGLQLIAVMGFQWKVLEPSMTQNSGPTNFLMGQ